MLVFLKVSKPLNQELYLDDIHLHPPSLRIFFVTEMWERYGFYVIQTLLALFLTIHFKWPDKKIYFLVSAFTALNYLSPFLGGWLADRFLGQKQAILIGAIVLFFSYFCLSFIDTNSSLTLFLAGIVVGTGLLKPNISSLLGNEYPENSLKRDNGFTLFYMGLATGIVLGTLLPSQLQAHFGWSLTFASAALAMLVAIGIFVYGIRRYQIVDCQPDHYTWNKLVSALGLISLLWIFSFYILNRPNWANYMILLIGLFAIGYFIWSIMHESPFQARKTSIVVLLCLTSVLFWAFYFQMFMSLTLFLFRVADPSLFNIKFYPPYYISIQSIGLILFGFILTRKPENFSNKPHSTLEETAHQAANKFLWSMIFMTLSYFLIVLICDWDPSSQLLSPLYFIPVYLLISLAEILLSPVGLSAVSRLANNQKVSTFVGIFFVTLGVGAFLSGKLADLTVLPSQDLSIEEIKIHYGKGFKQQLYILLGGTLLSLVFNYLIKRLIQSARLLTPR